VPERFLDGGAAATSVDFRGQHFELLPFGAGRRVCPGLGFAEASAEMALASLLYHFDWEAAGGQGSRSRSREGTPTPSLDMTEVNGLAVHIKSGLPLVAKPWIPQGFVAFFVVIWQKLSNYGLTRLKRFFSTFTDKLCNWLFFTYI
jgi:hypothetical protein